MVPNLGLVAQDSQACTSSSDCLAHVSCLLSVLVESLLFLWFLYKEQRCSDLHHQNKHLLLLDRLTLVHFLFLSCLLWSLGPLRSLSALNITVTLTQQLTQWLLFLICSDSRKLRLKIHLYLRQRAPSDHPWSPELSRCLGNRIKIIERHCRRHKVIEFRLICCEKSSFGFSSLKMLNWAVHKSSVQPAQILFGIKNE